MGCAKGKEERITIVAQNGQGPEGAKIGEWGRTGIPLDAERKPLEGSRLIWDCTADMGLATDKEQLTSAEQGWTRVDGCEHHHQRKTRN